MGSQLWTPEQRLVLDVLRRHPTGRMGVQKLSKLAHLLPSDAARAVSELVRAGLVVTTRENGTTKVQCRGDVTTG